MSYGKEPLRGEKKAGNELQEKKKIDVLCGSPSTSPASSFIQHFAFIIHVLRSWKLFLEEISAGRQLEGHADGEISVKCEGEFKGALV